MKLTKRIKSKIKDFKQKWTDFKILNKRKHMKVFAWYRNCKAWNLNLDRRLQQHNTAPDSIDETERECYNCGQHYVGRICPQCGQAGTWSRYTWKQAILNFLDIWGLGNRPMFRTLREMFWRPGYMIRDYLNGHRQFYFPPFKLVAVAVLLLIFVGWLTGTHNLSPLSFLTELTGLNEVDGWEGVKEFVQSHLAHTDFKISSSLFSIICALVWFVLFLSKNMLYEWLFIGAIAVICIWIAFKNKNRYNFVETYIFLTYVLALFLICMIPFTLLLWLNRSCAVVSPILHSCSGFVLVLYIIAVCYLILLVFKQFFGLSWISTISHIFLSLFVGIVLLFVTSGFITSMATEDSEGLESLMYIIIGIALIAQGFTYAAKFLKSNKEQVPRSVITGSKVAMLSILSIPKVMIDDYDSIFIFVINILLLVMVAMLVVTLSLLPVVIYKRYHHKWLALLSFLPIVILIILI